MLCTTAIDKGWVFVCQRGGVLRDSLTTAGGRQKSCDVDCAVAHTCTAAQHTRQILELIDISDKTTFKMKELADKGKR